MLLFGVLPLFGQNWAHKCTKNGQKRVNFFLSAFGAKNFKALPLFGCCLYLSKNLFLKCMLLFGVLPLLGCCSYLGGGYPLFGQFFSKIPGSHPTPRRNLKSGEFPPAGPSAGGKTALFSGIRRLHSPGARDLPKIVYLEGPPYNPP